MVTPIGKCILLLVSYSAELLNIIEQSCDNIFDIAEIPDLEEVPHTVEGRDLKTLITVSIETLKYSNNKCGKEEVLHLVQESVDNEIRKEHCEDHLNKLIKCHSVQIKLVGRRTCLYISKRAQHSKSHKQCNESLRINVNKELSKSKNTVIEEFDTLKVYSFKKRSCGNDILLRIESV